MYSGRLGHCGVLHVPHWQFDLQVFVPPLPQDDVELGEQAPCQEQVFHEFQTPVLVLQVRDCVPQFPHLLNQYTSPFRHFLQNDQARIHQ